MSDRERIAELEQRSYRLLEELADARAQMRKAADALSFPGLAPIGMDEIVYDEIRRIQQQLRQAGEQTFRG